MARLALARSRTYDEMVLSRGPIGYWPSMRSTTSLFDVSGRAHPGTITASVLPIPGPLNDGDTAMRLDGTAGQVTVGAASDFALTVGTLVIWARYTSIVGSYLGVFVKGNAYAIFHTPNKTLGFFDWGNSVGRDSGIAFNDGRWHQLGLTFQSGVTNGTLMYLDGKSVFTTTMLVQNQTQPLDVGNNQGQNQWWPGDLAKPAIYDRLLTAADFRQLYDAQTAPALTRRVFVMLPSATVPPFGANFTARSRDQAGLGVHSRVPIVSLHSRFPFISIRAR